MIQSVRTTTMRLAVFAAALLATTGCSRRPRTAAVPPLPKVEISKIRAPASPTVVVESGSNLRAVAAAAYGHEDFSDFVGQLNGIASPEGLIAGTTLKTPSLPIAFRDAKLDPHYLPAIDALAKAWQDLQTALPDYTKERNASGLHDGQAFSISEDLRTRITHCADTIDAALDVLRHPLPGHNTPHKTIGQFASVSDSLRRLSAGVIYSRDYDTFMLQKRFGLGFANALMWAKAGSQ
jgi:hypothetical protein